MAFCPSGSDGSLSTNLIERPSNMETPQSATPGRCKCDRCWIEFCEENANDPQFQFLIQSPVFRQDNWVGREVDQPHG